MAVLSLPTRTNGTEGTDRQMATLAREKFRNFVIRDSIAMLLSMFAIAIYFIASFPIKDMKTVGTSLFFGNMLILFATLTMVVALLDGLQALLYPSLSLDWITGFIIVACVPIFFEIDTQPKVDVVSFESQVIHIIC